MTDITVASTTDTQEDINAAAGIPADGGVIPPEQEATPGTAGEQPAVQNPPESESGKSEAKPGEQPAKPQPAAGSEPASDEEGKKKGSLQRRIDKLTAERYAQADEIADLRRKLAEATAGAKPAEAEVKADEKPVREKFKSDAEFYEALGRWGARQEVAESQAKTAETEEQAALEQTYSVYNRAVSKFRSEHDDFDDVVGREDLRIPQAVQVAVIELGDAGPEVAYYLGQHPEVCDKLNGMTDARAIVEVGRIAVALEKAAAPAPVVAPAAAAPAVAAPVAAPAGGSASAAGASRKPVSKAPPPTAAVGTSKTAQTPMDELEYQQYKAARERDIRARRGL